MKRILYSLIYLIISNYCCLGQGPSKFPLSGATWICSVGPGGPGENFYMSERYQIPNFNYDTIIGNFHYSKVYGGSVGSPLTSYFCALRFDSISNKIYAVKYGEAVERQIMDQSKLPGDTIFNLGTFDASGQENFFDSVVVVSKVPFSGNYNGIGFNTEFYVLNSIPYNGYYSFWLKNIGFHNFFLYWEGLLVSAQHFLECLFYNDTMYKLNPNSELPCLEEYTSIIEQNTFPNQNELSINNNEICINLLNKKGVEGLRIIDFCGKEFYSNYNVLNKSIILEKSNLPKGLYILNIFSSNGLKTTKFSIE